MGARWSMPLVDKVILAEDYQTGTAVLDSISNRAICEDLEVRWGNGGNGLKRKVSLLGRCHFFSTRVMAVGIGGGLSHGGMKNCSQEGGG